MNDEVLQLIKAAIASGKHELDVIEVRLCDLKDLVDAYDFFLSRRGPQSPLWTPNGVQPLSSVDAAPFTKRLERLKKEAEHACDDMNKLFTRVEPEGRKRLNTAFGFVVRSMTKVADEIMAVHREHYECTPKGKA